MVKLEIRKIVVQIDEIHKEINKIIPNPPIKSIAAAVINNPFANKYVEDLEPLYDIGAEIGGYLANKSVKLLGVNPDDVYLATPTVILKSSKRIPFLLDDVDPGKSPKYKSAELLISQFQLLPLYVAT